MLADTSNMIRDELNPGERIIWSGQPQQGFLLRPSDALRIPFSLLWSSLVTFMFFDAVSGSTPDFFSLFFFLFFLVGLYVMFGRFFIDLAQRKKTFYALTNERIIILSGLLNQNVKSINFKKLPEINLSVKRNGRGTIIFGTSHPWDWFYAGSGWPTRGSYNLSPRFEMIEDVKIVYQQIKRLQRGDVESEQ
jgi:hypothetical protein